jgi:hypothetical protein
MYTSLRRKFDPNRDAEPHPQLLYVMAQKKPGPNIFWIFRQPGCLYETL